MGKFQKKPIIVEAVQWNKPGDHPAVFCRTFGNETELPYVKGKQGYVPVHEGDWIITELDGSGYYPCADDVFHATYEEVEKPNGGQVRGLNNMEFDTSILSLGQ